ncbi:hypothetical protein VTJ83DRAFT_957 [Remersonia thermophila]|uniref:Inositol-pentakisphosphate 2-kinase n=1 Tax=Remersonia thermophila TaxID=72144 RepID=A0ABR4DN01_9PEZI
MYQLIEEVPYEFRLVGEGAANCVFEVLGYPPDPTHSCLQGNLLRVAKAGKKSYGHDEIQAYWESVVRPLFRPDDLVRQQLVKLGGRRIVSRLNAVLENEESTRRVDFRGTRVAEAEYGMLVEDMRQRRPGDLTLEFKPKWLVQSPTAPPTATRCRNCAREVLKKCQRQPPPPSRQQQSTGNAEASQEEHEGETTILCPLNFIACATSADSLATLLAHLLPRCNPPRLGPIPRSVSAASAPASAAAASSSSLSLQHDRLSRWLQTNTLLPRLRAAQLTCSSSSSPSLLFSLPSPPASSSSCRPFPTALSPPSPGRETPHLHRPPSPPASSPSLLAAHAPPPGPPARPGDAGAFAGEAAESLALAMTLRDCTCFIRIPADPSQPVEAKLADLDRKRGDVKLSYWQKTERELIEGGFYFDQRAVEAGVAVDCWLGRLKTLLERGEDGAGGGGGGG